MCLCGVTSNEGVVGVCSGIALSGLCGQGYILKPGGICLRIAIVAFETFRFWIQILRNL